MQGELDDATSALWNLRHLFSFRFCVTAKRKRNGSGCRFDVECNVGAAAGPGTRGTSALPYGRGRAARNGRAKGARRGAGRGRAGRRAALHRTAIPCIQLRNTPQKSFRSSMSALRRTKQIETNFRAGKTFLSET
jgi:hypothetical protein